MLEPQGAAALVAVAVGHEDGRRCVLAGPRTTPVLTVPVLTVPVLTVPVLLHTVLTVGTVLARTVLVRTVLTVVEVLARRVRLSLFKVGGVLEVVPVLGVLAASHDGLRLAECLAGPSPRLDG
ncbi:MAG TPA: hypothetical protein VME46_07715 [Acidimicrobiales bacterium]|nr:hypothetical protein [Acidimicrobiales bacterium]